MDGLCFGEHVSGGGKEDLLGIMVHFHGYSRAVPRQYATAIKGNYIEYPYYVIHAYGCLALGHSVVDNTLINRKQPIRRASGAACPGAGDVLNEAQGCHA